MSENKDSPVNQIIKKKLNTHFKCGLYMLLFQIRYASFFEQRSKDHVVVSCLHYLIHHYRNLMTFGHAVHDVKKQNFTHCL